MRDFQTTFRSSVHAAHGMVASAQPYASIAGLDILRRGGSAADAAVAMAAVLAVVEPMSTGIGGDAFFLVARKGSAEVRGYNGSGAAPQDLSIDKITSAQGGRIPIHSPHAVTIPGAVDAWCALHEAHGRLALDQVLEPAIALARDGFVVSPRIGHEWAALEGDLRGNAAGARHVLLDGGAPAIGAVMRQNALAQTLTGIGRFGRAAFYQGEIAEEMCASLNALGGLHRIADFANHRGEWVTPISSAYRGLDIYEIPPNGQGVTTLLMLNILENFDLGADPDAALRWHLEIEATRLAYAERDKSIADPRFAAVPTDQLRDKDFARKLAARISLTRAGSPLPATSSEHDTTYLAVADASGLIVSFINSLYHRFGACIASERSGVLFHCRGAGFVLDPGHPNALQGGKRPFHTIIPAMALKGGTPMMAFGVMGGDYQAVGQTHVVTNMVDFAMGPQAALDHPRTFLEYGAVQLERRIDPAVARALEALGHRIVPAPYAFGGGQIVMIDADHDTYIGASEPRRDGLALGY